MDDPRTGVTEPDAYRGRGHEKILAQMIRDQFAGEPFFLCEIGVWSGYTAGYLLEQFPEMAYCGIDPFVPYSGTSRVLLPTAKEQCLARLAPYPKAQLIELPSLDACLTFPDGFFDVVFIDGDHKHDSCLADLRAWSPKCRGIFCGHDYAGASVRTAVHDFSEETGRPVTTEGCMMWRIGDEPDAQAPEAEGEG